MSWRLRVRSQKERSLNTNGDVVLRPAEEILNHGVGHVAGAEQQDLPARASTKERKNEEIEQNKKGQHSSQFNSIQSHVGQVVIRGKDDAVMNN